MANVGSPALANDMNVFYNRLNTVRKNHSLASVNKSFVSNTPTLSSQMISLKSDLEDTTKSSKYIVDKTFDLNEIGIGNPTKYQTFSAIDSALDYLESACVHDASYNGSYRSNEGDRSDRDSHWAGDVNHGDIDRNYGDVD